MGKLLRHKKAKPEELFFGGKGVIIPMPFGQPSTDPSPTPSNVSPKQPGPPKPKPEGTA